MSKTLLSADKNALFRFKFFTFTGRFLARILAFLGFRSRDTKTSSTCIWIFRKAGCSAKLKHQSTDEGQKYPHARVWMGSKRLETCTRAKRPSVFI